MLLLAIGVLLHAGDACVEAQSLTHLPFWTPNDMLGIVGTLDFGAEVPQSYTSTSGWPGTHYATSVPIDPTNSWAYSWTIDNWATPAQRTFRVTRTQTSDFQSFNNTETVFSALQPSAQGFANIVQRPTDGNLFAFSWASAPTGSLGNLDVWQSDANGANWQSLGTAYNGHDAMNIIWHPGLGKFLNYQTHLKPWPEKDPDDNLPNLRRVIEFRTSTDGVNWQQISPEFLGGETYWEPDALDHEDMEFYRVATFPTMGRYAMQLLNYKADPNNPGQHSQIRYKTEWAISNDGLNWERPFRDIDTEENTGWTPVQGPMLAPQGLLFNHSGDFANMPDDRIFHVSSTSDAQFTTLPLTIPATGLYLNANVSGSAYVRAELLDGSGQVIPGYENSNLLIQNQDTKNLLLTWNGDDAHQLAGQTAKLRIFMRDAKIYDVHYGGGPGSFDPMSIGYWRFEETQGTTAVDSGVLPLYNGPLLGGAATSATSVPGATIPWTGESNLRSMEFDGINGTAVSWDALGSAALDVGTTDFTLEAWIAPRNADNFGLIAGKLVSGAFSDHGYDLHVRPTGEQPGASTYVIKFEARDPDGGGAGGGAGFSIVSGDLPFDQWLHVAGVRDGNELRLYLDGQLAGTAPLSGIADFGSLQTFAVGGGKQGAGSFERAFDGYIDEVRLTMQALTQDHLLNAAQLVSMDADFNDDSLVDGHDFMIWQRNFNDYSGSATNADGDANGDGYVDGADVDVWQDQFGGAGGASAAALAVPEPSSGLLWFGAMVILRAPRRPKDECRSSPRASGTKILRVAEVPWQ